jgi:hypothetical protein
MTVAVTPDEGLLAEATICCDHLLYRLRRDGSHKLIDLVRDLPSGSLRTEHQPCDRNDDYQQWRDREERVVSQRCGQPRHFVFVPCLERLLK